MSVATPDQNTPAPLLTIVVPTFNEKGNIALLVDKLRKTLGKTSWEVIFVDDDSPDGTSQEVKKIGALDNRVRGITRLGRRGLAGACIEGFLASQAKYIAVMDADLQHDESLINSMLEKIENNHDLIVASRYIDGGSSSGFSALRAKISLCSTALARRFLKINLRDPMSGFFMIRRSIVEEVVHSLSTQGYKILLDIVATKQGELRIAELPYKFRSRLHGESKLDSNVAMDFLSLLINKLTYGLISLRFILFGFVGLTGLILHLIFLKFGLMGGLQFELAQAVTTPIVIAWNFMLNNFLTYRDQRLSGVRFFTGLIRFELICSIGVISNVGVASFVYSSEKIWWLAGIAGVMMGVMWNYLISSAFVWKTK
jgi:dolichol-phosphate mannosyltransferase